MALPPQIGALVKLEVFDLEGTELMYLPKEIGELTRLRCFKVSFCARSSRYRKANQQIQRTIPEKVFSRLIQMYELSIDLNPDGEWSEDDVQAILTELSSLKKLKIIQLYLPSGQLLQQLRWAGTELIYSNLSRFRLTVGCHRQRFISRLSDVIEQKFKTWETSRNCLKYINGKKISNGITEALEHTHVLLLDRHWTVKHLSEFGMKNMDNLKYCLLVECNELETIIDGDHKSLTDVANDPEPALGSLCYLGIHYMKSLQNIWRGHIHKDSLSKLTFLHLHSCPNLITVFPPALCANLQVLESLIVEDCPKINSLISQRAPNLISSSPGYFLLNLKHVSLLHLPELDSISNGMRVFPALGRLLVYDCPKLQTILSVDTSCDVVTIIGEKKWWEALEWQDSEIDFPRQTFNELTGGQDLMNHVARLMYPESMVI